MGFRPALTLTTLTTLTTLNTLETLTMTAPATYREPIGRFVVEYLERLPEAHRAELRLAGIDPDDRWLLSWSFEDEADAERCAAEEREGIFGDIRTYRVRDRGADAPRYIERVCW